MKQLETKSCEEIMTTLYPPLEFVIDGLLAQGLYLLAGAPKVGKSWLALDICLSVAKGADVLGRPTRQSEVLYLCLEDNYTRIQSRLYELTEEPADGLFFSVFSDSIGDGLEEEIAKFKSVHPQLKLVMIDTLQMVRAQEESTYGSDYRDLSLLKALAQRLNICIVLIHHIRKMKDSDPFNMISGSTGLTGCVDGSFVLAKVKRCSEKAVLHCTGRDIESCELELERIESRWTTVHDERPKRDMFPLMIHDFIVERGYYKNTATALADELFVKYGERIYPNMLTKKLLRNVSVLKGLGVSFDIRKSHGIRKLELQYQREGDRGDGSILCVELAGPADPRASQTPENIESEQGDGSAGNCSEAVPRERADPLGEIIDVPYEAVSEPADTASPEQPLLLTDTTPPPKPPNPPHIPKRKKKKGRSRHRRR